MFQFKKTAKVPLILIQCECGREFIQEEMYCCLTCQNSICRYCTSNEIFCYYCRSCGDVNISSENNMLTVNCTSCFECPICKNVLRRHIDTDKNYGFICTYCFYTTKSIGINDPNYQQTYAKLNQVYKSEFDQEYKDFHEQYSRIKSIENNNQFLRKQQKTKHIIKSLTQASGKVEILSHQTNNVIEKNQLEKQQKIIESRNQLEINKKQILLQDYIPTEQQSIPLPIPLGLLSRKNRKCRKCQKLIVSLQSDKNSKKMIYTVQNIHYEYAPYFQVGKVAFANKEKTELSVMLHIFNKTKNSMECILNPLNSQILEQYKLLPIKTLPSNTYTFNNDNIDNEVQQHQKFEAILNIKDITKVQFAFIVDAKIKMPIEQARIQFNVNVYIGVL